MMRHGRAARALVAAVVAVAAGGLAPTHAFAQDRPELAIVPLAGAPGVAQADLDRAARGLASAVQAEGGVLAVYDTDLASRFGSKGSEALASARDALAEGRRLMQEGDADLALAFLQQAVGAHEDAGSEVIRKGEAADAHYALGRAYLVTYQREQAQIEFENAIALVPDYMDTRADAVNADIIRITDAATAELADRPPATFAPTQAQSLEKTLGVQCLAYGTVDHDGNVSINVQNGAAVRYTVERPGPFEPPSVGDPWYADMAAQIVAACRGEAVPTWTPPVSTVKDPVIKDPVHQPTTRKRTAVTASVLSVLVLGAAGAGAAYYVWPDAGTAPPTWTVTVTGP